MKMKKAKRDAAATALCRGEIDGVKCKYFRPLHWGAHAPCICHFGLDNGKMRRDNPCECTKKEPKPDGFKENRKRNWKNGGVANAGTKRNN